MDWCRQATSHYLNQCWPRSPTPYGVTRPHWVNLRWWCGMGHTSNGILYTHVQRVQFKLDLWLCMQKQFCSWTFNSMYWAHVWTITVYWWHINCALPPATISPCEHRCPPSVHSVCPLKYAHGFIISHTQRSYFGYIGFTPSARPSVRLSVRPASRVRSVVSTVQDRFFTYLVQMINSIRGCVACDDPWPWPTSSRSFGLDLENRVRSVACTVLDGLFFIFCTNNYYY